MNCHAELVSASHNGYDETLKRVHNDETQQIDRHCEELSDVTISSSQEPSKKLSIH
ncbi:hypothetical protein [Seonamhaeicola sp. ML3]|uniref:hypothetical protein n=1 Tax=Seonamhaeicola sp. ML3 TaxID=2937786 RepID=UPI00200D67C1|nr:hypothetical protein [Seonamhaeicola sp. ML3]